MEYSGRRKFISSIHSVQTGSLVELYPNDLQLYKIPPSSSISLAEFEDLAQERLKILRTIDNINLRGLNKYSVEWKGALTAELKKLGLKSFAKLINGTGCGQTESDLQIRKRDHVSHFILRLAYSGSEELRRWFLSREQDLFRTRFTSLSAEGIQRFMQVNNLKYEPISEAVKAQLRQCLFESSFAMLSMASVDAHEFYRVPYTDVQDLVRSRKVYLCGGFAYVPCTDLISILSTVFRINLAHGMAVTARMLPSLEGDERVFRLLKNLHQSYTGEEYSSLKNSNVGSIQLDQVDLLSLHSFPPCMRKLREHLRSNHHMRHGGRMQFGLFLKGIGLSLEDALQFWRDGFSEKTDAGKFEKNYAYNIRHNYGKEGKRVNYTPYSCLKIIMSSVGPDDAHGCPFRHSDLSHLKQQLLAWNVPVAGINEVAELVSQGHYQLACAKYFQLSHGAQCDEGIIHPNQYFVQSQNVLRAKRGIGEAETGAAVENKNTAAGMDDVWGDDLDLEAIAVDMHEVNAVNTTFTEDSSFCCSQFVRSWKLRMEYLKRQEKS
ncbi:DNA primase large subunit-like isoform X2 [Zootermopsis nevadensis]|uniref:DNA primase large subunit-like isoform X2 n=2 Tax=Zootermopsis nevadensis TaxID=136037 RepID=UPI000B8E2B3D|nr:DNA primase large subunit-like isoform X2 [Zootermopsis nevadensis]